jgi:hypothetical protein
VLAALPSYIPVCEELSSRHGENFSVSALVTEVAREADGLLTGPRDHPDEARLEAIAEALELVATEPRVDVPAVFEAFFAALSPPARHRFDAYLGPLSQQRSTGGDDRGDLACDREISPAAPRRLRPRPRRYSGRGPRRRRRL